MRRLQMVLAMAAVVIAGAGVRQVLAEVVRVEIRQRLPFADGHAFGATGPYEKITGRLYFEVDPDAAANARITDLKLAPRNARGRVEFWSDFFLLKPVDLKRGNRRLVFDVNNRGNKLALGNFNGAGGNNPTTLADAGNGFLMNRGFSLLTCGWNGDVMPGNDRVLAGLPVARQPDGRSITGPIHVEICRNEPVPSSPLYWTPWACAVAYEPADPDPRKARLSMRPTRARPAVEIPAGEWSFGRAADGTLELVLKQGFRPGWLYELAYVGKDPRVTGLGFAAVRDCVAFFRRDAGKRPKAANLLAGAVDKAYALGISQTGRFLNHMVYEGFNGDEAGRSVFDGLLVHVPGGGRGQFNMRFGMTTLAATAHEAQLSASESFPFTTVPETDPVSGREGQILSRDDKPGAHLPKIFYIQTSTEYWTRGASLLHTDVEGRRDVALASNTRLYLVAGAQHLGAGALERGPYQNLMNPLNDRPPVLRALLVALDGWATSGREPPTSRYPKIADGTLVDLATFGRMFPKIPGVNVPTTVYTPCRLDFGPRWESEGIADCIPPRVGEPFRTLVPAVGSDGNELAGVRLPDVAVPLATYTGWNLRARQAGAEGMLAPYQGSYLPFAKTAAERQRAGDPRRSVAERYPTREAYLSRYADAVRTLQSKGFLLESDAEALVNEASQRKL